MKLYIDDIRNPPAGWVVARSSRAAIHWLRDIDFDTISFDHDLGGDDTTRPVVIWLIENNKHPTCFVHTANPVGREWLEGMINKYLNDTPAVCN